MAPGTGNPTVWNSTVYALQKALALENRAEEYEEIKTKLQKLADETFKFTTPIFPQKSALDFFVKRSIEDFPDFFCACGENIELLHHLQRYAACYVAYKAGYFSEGGKTTKSPRIKILPPKLRTQSETGASGESARHLSSPSALPDHGRTVIQTFLAGCQPPMSHLFESFQRQHITGELYLEGMARWSEGDLRKYVSSQIAQTALEAEAIVQALLGKKSRV
ncbi:hypothetical protein K438DRAFT_1837021 [Mycena galopus ATCC 62051]|nr:hypothetical protein K438DRAFT_1837021 [Mycena galopus ATCC 62051]